MAITASVAGQDDGAPTESPLEYELSFDEAHNHYVKVRMTIDTTGQDTCELMMATWTPGSYLIREYARNIPEIAAYGADDVSLDIEKTTKNRWVVSCEGQDSIEVDYRVYCRETSVRTNFIDHEYAVLNGAATFLTVPGREDYPHEVLIHPRSNWARSITAMEQPDADRANFYRATDFDQIVDSPILVGNPSVYPFTVDGYEHWLVNLGDDELWNGAQAASDISKIVREHQAMWGSVPYERYLFLNVLAESGGGLEHDRSTLILSSRWTFRSSSRYRSWLGIVSHEYFHTWNVRTMRPSVLVDYDYENENYFPSLWIAEGVTSYYDDLALVRAGIVDKRQYLSQLSGTISGVQRTPGRQVQSLRDASHDAWIKYYRPDENSRNTTISYYTKGALVAFLLDAKIRQLTQNEASLDDVMRRCYDQFANGVGFDESEFRAVASEIAGTDLSEWFASTVDSTDELDFQEALDWYGLEFRGNRVENTDEPSRPIAQPSDRPRPSGSLWVGWTTSDDGGRLTVSGVERNSPAAAAGINVDDEILAINDYRATSSRLSDILGITGPEQEVDVLISRRGRLLTLPVTPTSRVSQSYSLAERREATEEQEASLELWLAPSTEEIVESSASDQE